MLSAEDIKYTVKIRYLVSQDTGVARVRAFWPQPPQSPEETPIRFNLEPVSEM